eukprot:Em0002g1107a
MEISEERERRDKEFDAERRRREDEREARERESQKRLEQMQAYMDNLAKLSLVEKLVEGTAVHRSRGPEITVKLVPLNEKDDVEAYLITFERIMAAHNISKDRWPHYLTSQLTGKAQLAFAAVSPSDNGNYEKIKAAILIRYGINDKEYRRRFRSERRKDGETNRELAVRLMEWQAKWLKECQTVEDVLNAVGKEQFLNTLPTDKKLWVLERKPETCVKAGELADEYEQARWPEMESLASSTSKPNRVGSRESGPAEPGFKFPRREIGKQHRSFQPIWFSKWKWLHYSESDDKVFCHTCVKAVRDFKRSSKNAEEAFLTRGYNNWKAATDAFRKHESSDCHAQSVEKLYTLPSTTKDIGETLSTLHAQEKLQNRQCLLKVFSALRFLSRQCCAIRGDADENDCNFVQLLKLCGESDIKLQEWMIKGRDKYLCHEAQNEMLKIMALKVLKDIGLCLHKSPFYTIMADETTDKTNKEQVTLVLRWMDDSNFEVHEEFIGLYEVESITSDSIVVSVVKDTLIRLNLSLSKARGQCYDGASNMSGIRNGASSYSAMQGGTKSRIHSLLWPCIEPRCFGCYQRFKSYEIMS